MPNSYVEITSNGSASQTLSFSFPYLNQTDIGVTVDGVTQTLTTHWSFATTQSIVFVSHPANGAVIRISRTTPSATRVVDFQDGSVLSEADLDNSADQIFFIAQEAADTAAQSIILDTDGKWEANSKPIKNVTNPTNAQDAVTKNYLENTWLSTSDKTQLNNLNTTNLNTVAGSVSNVNTVAGAITNVNTVAGKSPEIAALGTSSNVSNMDTLAASGVVGNIASVAGISSDVTTVAGKASLITSDFVSDLNTVAVTDVINDINTLATSDVVSDLNQLATSDFVSDLNQLATTTNVNNLGTVAGIAGNVTSVAGVASDVSTVAGISSAISTVAADGTDIGTVAGISSAVSTVSSNNANVSTVAGAVSNIGTVAGAVSNVNSVGSSIGNVNTVAGISSAVSTVAADATDIGNVSGSIANVNTVATNISGVNSFAAQYRTGSSDPTSSLDTGDLFYNTTANQLKIYNGSAWENAAPAGSGFLATSGGNMTGNLAYGDNVKVTFGAGSDLEIYSDGNSSFIKENSGTGSLFIDANYVEIRKPDGSAVNAKFFDGGSAELYHNNAKMFETTSTGINVTGTVQADQFNNDEALPDIRPSLLLDFANSKTLDPRITFTRGSTATYYDGHTTAKAEENLLTYSQELDNGAWGKNDSAVSANSIAAPDGTTTADTVTADGGSAIAHGVLSNTAISSAAATVSVYAKKGSQSVLQILFYGPASNIWQNYNLDNGSLGSGNSSHAEQTAQSITDVGNGWYRCTVSGDFSSSNATDILFAIKSSATSVRAATETNSGTIYLWGAQLEQRSAPTAYTATTSAPIVKYQPTLQTAASGAARFDHNPTTGESKGLLIEEARTNLVPDSEDFNASFSLSAVSVSANTVIAPDGTLTADSIIEDTASSNHFIYKSNVYGGADNTATASVYIKANGSRDVQLQFLGNSGSSGYRAYISLSDGSITTAYGVGTTAGSGSASTEYIGNGWYRCIITATPATTGNTSSLLYISPVLSGATTSSYQGNGYSGIYLWGAQLEAGSFPTSYIPTSGSTVTRAVDSVRMLLASFAGIYNPTESTMFSEFSSISDDTGYVRIWDIGSLTTNNNRFALMHFPRSSVENITMEYRTNNTSQASLSVISNTLVVTNAKVAATWAQNDFAAVANGGTVLTDGTGSIYSSIPRDTLGIGNATGLGNDLTGHLKKLAYYPKRLSNATLQAMTEA